jgi:plasmid stabilization system protein ParE
MNAYTVVVTTAAREDYARIEDFALERELQSGAPDYGVIDRMSSTFDRAIRMLEFAPYSFRRCETRPERRELVAAFGGSGFVMLFEIREDRVFVVAVRHQLERDFNH